MNLLENTVAVFLAFFAIMNPIANTAVFAALVGNKGAAEERRIAAKALLITFVIVLLFSAFGKSIFHLFGITLPALRVTGGVLVFLIGYHMLHGSNSRLHTSDGSGDSDVAVSPLAVPLLAGPGTIATAMNYSASSGWTGIAITLISFLVLCVITFFCFVFSTPIINKIGNDGIGIITRLMGLILAVVGAQMLIEGARAAFSLGG